MHLPLCVVFLTALFCMQHRAVSGMKPHVTCTRTYTKLGCYKASDSNHKTLLVTDRDRSHLKYQGHTVEWRNWNVYVHSLACRCAVEARKHNIRLFALQNYAECWGLSDPGNIHSSRCFKDFKTPCDDADPLHECMGRPDVNYVYELKQTDPCQPDPCKNSGKCIPNGDSFRCVCPTTHTGKICDQVCHSDVIDLGIILDASGDSSKESLFLSTKQFLVRLVRKLRVSQGGTHVGLISYGSNAMDLKFTKSEKDFLWPLLLLNFRGGKSRTDLDLERADKLFSPVGGDRTRIPNVLLVITRHNTGPGSKPYSEVLKPLMAKGVRILAFGVGNSVDMKELRTITMGKDGSAFLLPDTDNIDVAIVAKFLKGTC